MAKRAEYTILVDTLREAFGDRLKTLVLFGSYARGTASPESDHDVLAVIEGLPREPLARQRIVRGALFPAFADLPGPIGLVAKTPTEFQTNLTPLLLDVIADGVCLYGEDFFEPYRTKGLRALAQSGFQRRDLAGSLAWIAPPEAGKDWELEWDGYHERSR